FGGRAMRADQPGKYVNSPQTELFNKSAVLYGLDIAKAAIRRRSEAVIVEGYFDVIACHQAGLDGVVASMGTALTEDQYRILDDLKIERAIVAFDGDAAGKASAERRGRELARIVQRAEVRAGRRGSVATRTGLTVYVAVLPEGRDPDDLARSDPERLRAVLAEAQPVLTFLIERAKQRSDLERPEGRRRFLNETLPLVADEPDQLTRELYLGTLSSLTGVREETLRERLAAASTEAGAPPERASRAVRAASERWAGQGTAPAEGEGAERRERTPSIERYLMAQLVQFPEEAAHLDLDPDELVDPDHRAILELFRAGERPGPRFPDHLAAVVAALGAQAPAPVEEEHAARAIEMAVLKVREEHVRRQLGEKRSALARASASGGDVGGLAHEVARLGEELDHAMRAREPQTVLREIRNEEDQ
ncbi:MAG: toprim domain-containing protein, partial [Chloroflexota bacterium]